jgi:hypothetical protein
MKKPTMAPFLLSKSWSRAHGAGRDDRHGNLNGTSDESASAYCRAVCRATGVRRVTDVR